MKSDLKCGKNQINLWFLTLKSLIFSSVFTLKHVLNVFVSKFVCFSSSQFIRYMILKLLLNLNKMFTDAMFLFIQILMR